MHKQALVVGMGQLLALSPQGRAHALAAVEPLPQAPSADESLYPLYNGYYLVYHARTLLKELWKCVRSLWCGLCVVLGFVCGGCLNKHEF